jgi:D-alanyl-D-alanine carboxypeptidase
VALSLTVASCAGGNPSKAGSRGSDRTSSATNTSSDSASPSPGGFEADVAAIQQAMGIIVGDGVPGVVVLVRHGRDLRVLARGQADLAAKAPMSPRDVFRIGSITKSMVAVTILKLVERGVLSLNDTVDRWLPGLVPHGDAITIKQLLNHSSGLANFTDLPLFASVPRGTPLSPRELVRLAASQPILFPPGRGKHYSNTGYIVLGMIIEKATRRSLASNLHSAVFAPAHMNASSLGSPAASTAPVARGYENGKDETGFPLGWAWAAGAVISDAHDVAAFFNHLLSGRLLPRDLLARMQTPGEPMPEVGFAGYGLGLAEVNTACGTAWGHEGQLPGYVSAAWVNQRADRQVVVLANATVEAFDIMSQRVINTALCGAT